MRVIVLSGLVVSLTCSTMTAWGQGPRLEWQPESSSLSWHRNCAFSNHPSTLNCESHRFVTLQAQLRTFAPEDASLYAVYLKDRKDLGQIEKLLAKDAGLLSTKESWGAEWLPLDTNGRITLRVDEASQKGKNWVAVLNGKGEVLGLRPLWAAGDMASQDRTFSKNPS